MERTSPPRLTLGDGLMAFVALWLSPLVSVPLCLYNFARRRPRQGWLYLSVLAVQVAALVAIRIVISRYIPT